MRDEEVMLAYQKDEVSAMDELLRRYKNPLYRFSLRLVGNDAEAQDIAQEVFLRLHQHRYEYRPIGKFSTWIFGIAHNIAVSHLRKSSRFVLWPRREEDPDQMMDFQNTDPSPEEIVADNEVNVAVKRCIQSLPFLQREALILREYENLDYEEIARILKKSLGTVKTLIHRARLQLKDKLLPYIEEFEGGSDE